jgi:hypothetical protein
VIVACGSVIFILFFNLTAFFFPLFSSLEISIARLRKLEDNSLKPSQNLKVNFLPLDSGKWILNTFE